MTDTSTTPTLPFDRWAILVDPRSGRTHILNRTADDLGDGPDGAPAPWHIAAPVLHTPDAPRILRLLEETTARQQVAAAQTMAAAAAMNEANALLNTPPTPDVIGRRAGETPVAG